jgi:small subunit ribosomal protein S17
MQKTAKVEVVRMLLHPVVLKYYKKRKKYLCHDEKEDCRDGDLVRIKECRPLSKRKHFTIEEIIERAEHYTDPVTGKTFSKS